MTNETNTIQDSDVTDTDAGVDSPGAAETVTAADDTKIICVLTGEPVKDSEKEQTLQSLIRQMNEEYGFEMADLERDFTFIGEDEAGKKIRRKAELVAFEAGAEHTQAGIIRVCFVQDPKTKEADAKKGTVLLDDALNMLENCEFGLWTNGLMNSFRHRTGYKANLEAKLEEVSERARPWTT